MSARRFLNRSVAAAVAAAIAGAGAAHAQTGTAGANVLEEVIVTAQKREQTVIDVPQSISVVSGSELDRMAASTFSDFLKQVPGVQYSQASPGQGRIIMRGINTGGVASTVSIYLDETPFGSSSGLVNGAVLAGDFDPFDLARVEVLRGPQGTLYGASSMGGVMRYVTNAPSTDGFDAKLRLGADTVDDGKEGYNAAGMINVPLGESVAMRATGSYRKDGGFIDSIGTDGSTVDDDINESEVYGGRLSFLFAPSERFDARISALRQNIRADADTVVEANPDTLDMLNGGRPVFSQWTPSVSKVDYELYNATLNFHFGAADLISATSYSNQDLGFRTDLTYNLGIPFSGLFGPNDFFLAQDTDSEKFTQELRLASNQSGGFDWIVGAFYTSEDGYIRQQYVAVDPGTLTPIAGLPLLALVTLHSKYEEIAGFANGTIHFTDRFDLDLGGRYSRNEQHADQASDGLLVGGASVYPRASSSENVFTWSVAPKFSISADSSLYARAAKGYRAGGPNVLPPNAPADTPRTYDSDTLVSYEIGYKMQTADRRFALEAAAYHIDWDDIQLLVAVNGFGVNMNAGKAQSDGVEFSASFRPADGLSIGLNGAYIDAKLDEDAGPIVGGYKGDRLPFVPEFSGSLDAQYQWVSSTWKPYIGATLSYLSDQSAGFNADFRDLNGRQREVPSYTLVDLRAGIETGRFGVELYAKNIGDSDGIVSVGGTEANGLPLYPNGAISTGIVRPRTIGITFTMDF